MPGKCALQILARVHALTQLDSDENICAIKLTQKGSINKGWQKKQWHYKKRVVSIYETVLTFLDTLGDLLSIVEVDGKFRKLRSFL